MRSPAGATWLLIASLGAAALGLLGAAPASASPAWLSPAQKLSEPGRDALEPQIALDAGGDAVAVWERFDGAQPTPHSIIESASLPAGAGKWSLPQKLSEVGQSASEPQVALAPGGDGVAVWVRSDGAKLIVESASLAAGATKWFAAQKLSAPGQGASEPQVALDAGGDAVAVWARFDGAQPTPHKIVESARLPAGASKWSNPEPLSAPGQNATEPQVSLDAKGDAVAIWTRSDGAKLIVESAGLPAGAGKWSTALKVSEPGQDAVSPQVALDAGGGAVAVWARFDGAQPTPHKIVESASLPAGASKWSKPESLSERGQDALAPKVLLAQGGNAVAVWERFDGAQPTPHKIIESAGLRAGTIAWSLPQKLSEPGASGPQIALDAGGNAVAVWERTDSAQPNSHAVVESASLPGNMPAGAAKWSTPQKLSAPDASQPQVALDAGGDGVAVWVRPDGAQPTPNSIVEGDVYDATPPTLGALGVPQDGFVGQPLSFSASASDLFSALQLGWSFGDGGSASAATTTHAYGAPGSYQVSFSATDVAANRAAGTANVAIWQLLVSARATVKRGKAVVSVTCAGAGLCEGRLALDVPKPRLALGQLKFSLAAGKKTTLTLKLGAKAKRLLQKAPRKGLAVKVSGAGVKGTTLRLKSAGR